MNNDKHLIEQFINHHPEIAIPIIEEFEIQEIAILIEDLSSDYSISILSQIAPYKAGKVLEKLTIEQAVRSIDSLPLPNCESILRIVDKSICEQILQTIGGQKSKYLQQALRFTKDQVGAHLEPNVLTLNDRMNVEKALLSIKENDAVVKSHLFVLNKEKILLGYIELKELIASKMDRSIQSIMKEVPRTVFADMNTKELLEQWDDAFIDLPVVKINRQFLGTVSRISLSKLKSDKPAIDKSALKAGNALGDLYLIGLMSLLGNSDVNKKP
jgi:Mg/Co/Ni transporter MgtE